MGFARRLWERHIAPRLPGKFRLLRAYANGELYGTDGSPHVDALTSPPHFTLLYYPHDFDSKSRLGTGGFDHGGETMFFDEAGGLLKVVPMQSNSAVFFSSNVLHSGRAPSVLSFDLRITVAFKLLREG